MTAAYTRAKLQTGEVLARDDTIDLRAIEIAPGQSLGPRRHAKSDVVVLFYDGRGEIRSSDRVQAFSGTRHAFVPAATTYEIRNTGQGPLKLALGLCPDGPTEPAENHAPRATPGGATLLSIKQYDRFPDSGLVRGGMFFLEPGEEAGYHSHDGAAEIFVFLRGKCDLIVEGEMFRVRPGEVVYVPAEMKHRLSNVDTERLVVWLTVTPNVTPSHTFYRPLPDGTWERVTPRLDGGPSRPSTR